jgi:Protein of unknown function (DUF3048) N-terminal domain/Protein of unknown function (DUF3048) C-terminal domain
MFVNKEVAPRFAMLGGGLALLLMLSFAGACAGRAASPTPTPTKTPMIPAREATATSSPTFTPVPTDTPGPTATPTLDPSLIVPARDPGLSPFTGLRPADPAVLQRRPLAVKFANIAAVRPQSGLSKADVVVESQIEFSATRFTAIYQSQDAPRMGSIRSARLIDAELPVIFDAILCFSGASGPVRQKLYQSVFGDHILEANFYSQAYPRDPNIVAPNDMFTSTSALWAAAQNKGWNKTPKPTGAWVFSAAAPAGANGSAAASASKLDVAYPQGVVSWSYDAASGRWLRSIAGQAHIDTLDGKQLSAANVVLITANHVKTLILEYGATEMAGGANRSIEVQLWGEGPVKVLRDGKVYEGKWARPKADSPFRFLDAQGQDIPLKPGNSWWQVVPYEMKVTLYK